MGGGDEAREVVQSRGSRAAKISSHQLLLFVQICDRVIRTGQTVDL